MIRFRSRTGLWSALAAVGAGAAAMPARAQTLGLAPNHDISLWRVVGALVLCCLLGFAGALALRFRTRGKALPVRRLNPADWRQLLAGFGARTNATEEGAERLRLVGTVRLGYQVEVNLLECDGKTLVIVASPQGAFVAAPEATAAARNDSGGAS